MPKKEEENPFLKAITSDSNFITELAKDKNLKKSLSELKIKFVVPEAVARYGLVGPTQEEIANGYYNEIDEFLKSLENFSPERKKALDDQLTRSTWATGILPLVLTALSGGIFVVSNSLLSLLTNAFSVIPPLFINSIKAKTESYYKGAQIKATLIDMKYSIGRLAATAQLTPDVQKNLSDQLKKIASDISQL